jgi:hypothetical protein
VWALLIKHWNSHGRFQQLWPFAAGSVRSISISLM